YKLGMYFDINNYPEKSNTYLVQALEFAKLIENKRAAGIITNYLASCYSKQGKHSEVIRLYKEAYTSLIESGDSTAAADVLMNLGASYSDNGQADKALEAEINAMKIRSEYGDSSNIALYYQQIGELYKEIGQRDKWIKYLLQANKLAKNPLYARFETRVAILNDMGGYHAQKQDYSLAEEAYRQMFQLSKEKNYMPGIMVYLSNIVPIYKAQNRFSEALDSALESYRLAESQKKVYNMMSAGNVLASLYFDLGQLKKSEQWYKRVLKLSGGNAFPQERSRTLKGLYDLSKSFEDWKLATQYLEEYHLLIDSLENTKLQMRMAELETRFHSKQNEDQIKLLNSKNELQAQQIKLNHTISWGILLLSFMVLGVVSLFFWQSRIRAKTREMELEHKWLRTQMNPHFLFNALGSIQSFIHQHKDDKALFFLGKYADLTRAILINSRKDYIPLSEEIETLKNYIELEKMRLDVCFSYEIVYPDELDVDMISIPPMLVQPFIENAIKHGFRAQSKDCILTLAFSEENNILGIEVRDNGVGIKHANEKDDHQSMALRIFMERKKLIEKRMGDKIQLQITDLSELNTNQKGTLVEIKLPIPGQK
ncbi:MAG: histidine kinase, partial [Bacteroidales bacterium]|nr:histidine kinase [Bacteroidales bacterium]